MIQIILVARKQPERVRFIHKKKPEIISFIVKNGIDLLRFMEYDSYDKNIGYTRTYNN